MISEKKLKVKVIYCVILFMPCPILSNSEYPDYLKKILKQIEEENDEILQACACQLKSPQTDEGCLILDSDNKAGAFPFCWEYTEDLSLVGDGTFNPLKLTLKEVMWLYWESAKFSHSIPVREGQGCGCCDPIQITTHKDFKYDKGIPEPIEKNKKELVCKKDIGLVYKITGTIFTSPPCDSEDPCDCGCSVQYPINETYYQGSFFSSSYYCAYPVPGNLLPLKQYYIKEGDEYYFYPSFILHIGISYNTSLHTRADNDVGLLSCEYPDYEYHNRQIIEKDFKIYINNEEKPLKLYELSDRPIVCAYVPTYTLKELKITK